MQQPSSTTIDAAFAAAGSKITYGGAAGSVTGWLFSSEFGVVSGIVIGLIGLAINYYFKRREDNRLQAEHDAKMAAGFAANWAASERLGELIERARK